MFFALNSDGAPLDELEPDELAETVLAERMSALAPAAAVGRDPRSWAATATAVWDAYRTELRKLTRPADQPAAACCCVVRARSPSRRC